MLKKIYKLLLLNKISIIKIIDYKEELRYLEVKS